MEGITSREETLNSIRNRPRFRIETPATPEDFTENLKKALYKNEDLAGTTGKLASLIWVKTDENPFWKPRLTLSTEWVEAEKTTIIRGIFGPSQAVWTFFVFLYFLLSLALFCFLVMWYIQAELHDNTYTWAIYPVIILSVMLVLTYLAAMYGRSRSKAEIERLRNFAEEATAQYEAE